MYKLLLFLLLSLAFYACSERVEGCMHPRAENFNPEADEDLGCVYYQLVTEMQHTTHINDTFTYGYWLNDVDGTPFYIDKMPILLSEAHLVRANSSEEVIAYETLLISPNDGSLFATEDNYGLIEVGTYTTDVGAWVERGDFSQLRFKIGVPPAIDNSDPTEIEETAHPLAAGAATYMYDDSTDAYFTTYANVILPNQSDTLYFPIYEDFYFDFPYAVTAVDGADVPLRIKINYQAIFDGISFLNDDSTTVTTKIRQNIPAAISVF